MTHKNPDTLRHMALSRWDDEGGSVPEGTPQGAASRATEQDVPELTHAELVHLRVRVIALENLVIALLAGATDRQMDRANDMADYIVPRPGHTQHPLTTHAAKQMTDLVQRAGHFRTSPDAP